MFACCDGPSPTRPEPPKPAGAELTDDKLRALVDWFWDQRCSFRESVMLVWTC